MQALFVYGTLKTGERNSNRFAGTPAVRTSAARTPGRLVDLGGYPGLVAAESSSDWVRGEYLEFADIDALLTELDRFEDYRPEEVATCEYVRREVAAVLEDGSEQRAWAYLYNLPHAALPVIPGGEWHERGE
jgi:gamma-glutamylcyclotransferase (GGCT)/AIG2-like uncharacterized protein YtfP